MLIWEFTDFIKNLKEIIDNNFLIIDSQQAFDCIATSG